MNNTNHHKWLLASVFVIAAGCSSAPEKLAHEPAISTQCAVIADDTTTLTDNSANATYKNCITRQAHGQPRRGFWYRLVNSVVTTLITDGFNKRATAKN